LRYSSRYFRASSNASAGTKSPRIFGYVDSAVARHRSRVFASTATTFRRASSCSTSVPAALANLGLQLLAGVARDLQQLG